MIIAYFLRTALVSFSILLYTAYSEVCDDYFHPRP